MTCQNPEKQKHRTRRAALAARRALEAAKGIDLGLRPYRCEDHWHLGHSGGRGRYGRLQRELHRQASKVSIRAKEKR